MKRISTTRIYLTWRINGINLMVNFNKIKRKVLVLFTLLMDLYLKACLQMIMPMDLDLISSQMELLKLMVNGSKIFSNSDLQ